jgi:large subunit ribosomal protein L25
MAEVLQVESRTEQGRSGSKKLRQKGKIPAILYGHGEASISLSIDNEQMSSALRHHSRLVQLAGAVNESALIKDMQYDTYGIDILHVDFTRVSTDERIELEVRVELKGQAVGVREGGVLSHQIHDVEIECLAVAIPEKLIINVTNLKKGDSLHVSDIEVPEGVKILADKNLIVVSVSEPSEEAEALPGATGAEPELIKRKAGEEEGDEAEDK